MFDKVLFLWIGPICPIFFEVACCQKTALYQNAFSHFLFGAQLRCTPLFLSPAELTRVGCSPFEGFVRPTRFINEPQTNKNNRVNGNLIRKSNNLHLYKLKEQIHIYQNYFYFFLFYSYFMLVVFLHTKRSYIHFLT